MKRSSLLGVFVEHPRHLLSTPVCHLIMLRAANDELFYDDDEQVDL